MSQLNPNAAEFVPISPKRTTASLPYEKIMDDIVISQSPKRGADNDYDVNLPNLQEFETEIKMRPSDVEESAENDETNNVATLSSQEIMENLLNGKSIEEIEFQPNSTSIKFHFGFNSTGFVAPGGFMDQSELLSSKAVIGEDSDCMEDTQLDTSYNLNKSDDMMSFYQDKEDAENSRFDLNKVQVLPENIDDFLEKPKEEEANSLMDTTISDLPEHNPLEPENRIKSPALQKIYSDVVVEKEASFSIVELEQAVSSEPVESQSQLIIDERKSILEVNLSVLESQLVTLEPISPASPSHTRSHEVSPRLQSSTLIINEKEQLSPIMAKNEQRRHSSDFDIHEHRLHLPIVDLDESEAAQPALDLQEPVCTAQSPILDLLHSLINEQQQKTQSLLENKFDIEEQSLFVDLKSSYQVGEPVVKEMVIGVAQSSILAPSPQISKLPSPIPTAHSPVLAAQALIHMPQGLDCHIDDVTSSARDSPSPESSTEKSSGEVQAVGASNGYAEIKSETIAPEFLVKIVTTPCEKSKTDRLQSHENAAAVAVTTKAVPSVTEKKPISKPKTTTAVKKPLFKLSPTAMKAPSKPLATKPLMSKPTTKAVPAKPFTVTGKVSTIGKTTSNDKISITSKTVEKKLFLNSDVVKTFVKKSANNPTPLKAAPVMKTVPAKVSFTRTAVESKSTTRPVTSPPSTTSRLTAKTARLTTVAPKTTIAKSTTSSTPTKTTTVASKPKTTLSLKQKPLPPDTKEQIKETTNKQLTRATNKTLSTLGKATPKSVGSTLTKITAGKLGDKKPTQLVRHAAKPITTTGVVKKTKTATNGVSTKITTTTTITERKLIKDVSPVVENNMIDKSQIIKANNIAD